MAEAPLTGRSVVIMISIERPTDIFHVSRAAYFTGMF